MQVDPGIGLLGFEAVRQLARDYAWAVDIELCVFPQEGLVLIIGGLFMGGGRRQ
jgi:cytosine deaminase